MMLMIFPPMTGPLVNLLPIDTVFVDEGAELVPAMGLGAFVLDRAEVLQYRSVRQDKMTGIEIYICLVAPR